MDCEMTDEQRNNIIKNTYITVVTDTETGLFHGAIYRNRPTPSGCDRYVLSVTTRNGFSNKRDAFLSIHEDFPDFRFADVFQSFIGDQYGFAHSN